MRRLLMILVSIATAFNATAQGLEIHIDNDGGIIKACPGDVLALTATSNADADAQYYWDFDNGDHRTTTLPSVEYAYKDGGAYMLSVTLQKDGVSVTDAVKAVVGRQPDFSGYSNDINGSFSGICLGETFTLTMPISDRTTAYECRNYYYENAPQSLYGTSWSGKVMFKNFDGEAISAATDIASVGLTFGHESVPSVKVTLVAPDGRVAVLKDYGAELYGGTDAAVDGKAMKRYVFSADDAPGLADLIGSPVNGEWKVEITSGDPDGRCYVYGFDIELDGAILERHAWSFGSVYDLRRAVWSGKGVSATSSGIADAAPKEEGTTRYSFVISDDMGCMHDTAVYVSVELASFSGAEAPTVFIGDEVQFANRTSWATETTWHFGDNSPLEYAADAPHAYYERGNYEVVMETRSAKGCADVDTQFVSVIPRPLEVKEVNVFTPNGDGVNDVFTFFSEDDSFLSDGGLTKMPANIRSLKCKIYNSHGQTICKWESVRPSIFGWDGTVDNKGNRECPPGTYFYDLVVSGKDGTTLKRSGTILLYREK